MSNNSPFNIGDAPAETAVGGAFTPGLWIAPFTAGYVWQIGWVEADLDQFKRDVSAGIPSPLTNPDPGDEAGRTFGEILGDQVYDDIRKGREKRAYYYADRARAQSCARMLDEVEPAYRKGTSDTFKRNPAQYWRLETSVADTLTLSKEAKEKFESDIIKWEVPVKALGSSSAIQYQYHYLALPAAVKAYADLFNWTVPALKAVDELSGPSDEVIVTDELKGRLIGNDDMPAPESLAWLDRVALWAALGESEPRAQFWTEECWQAIGGQLEHYPDPGTTKTTDSVKLGEALRTLRTNWSTPTWAAVIRVPDPNPDSAYEAGGQKRQPSIPLFAAFYFNRDAAVAAVEAMDIEIDAAPVVSTSASDGSCPAVYDGNVDLWLGEVRKVVTEHLPTLTAAMAPVLRAKQVNDFCKSEAGAAVLAERLICTADEFKAGVAQALS